VESGLTLLRGIGELHLEIVCEKLRRQHGIEVTCGRAYVAFRESLDRNYLPIELWHTEFSILSLVSCII
jgi:elongation factor G